MTCAAATEIASGPLTLDVVFSGEFDGTLSNATEQFTFEPPSVIVARDVEGALDAFAVRGNVSLRARDAVRLSDV